MNIFDTENTHDLILHAAMNRFSHYGYKRTSLEDIANDANLSRPTIYAHFKNKKALLRAVSEGIHNTTIANIEIALCSDQKVEQRLLNCFLAWTEPYRSILFGSPHGAELIGENGTLANDISVLACETFDKLLTKVLVDLQKSGSINLTLINLTPSQAAEFMIASLNGISFVNANESTHKHYLQTLIKLFLNGCSTNTGIKK
ncbi:TetR/AcrR family transcriptional regulator [Moritella dasanensis]|uniref:TetR/AcrR family transcriptional regulator n=1 Tax=Moritella dasanensis TaxID=428031 RepID=UPI000307582C|nr:TetR/AcrR family transcriptional regulator [Moritella dasanensis]